MANIFKYTISVGTIITNDNGRPILPLIIDAAGKYRGYMMPFRSYGIDICATKDGEYTMGSSGVHGLDTTIDAIVTSKHPHSNYDSFGVAVVTVKGYCWACLTDFLSKEWGHGVDIADHINELDKAFSEFAEKIVRFYTAY